MHNMANSKVENYKVLVVTMKSATLKTKYKNAKIYAYAYVQPEAMLRTKVYRSQTTSSWDEKLVFSIPEGNSLSHQGSFVFFKVYKKGLARDSFIGIAKCDVLTLVESILLSQKLSSGYGTEEYCFEEDPRYPNMFEEDKEESFEEDPIYPNWFEEKKKEVKQTTCLEILKGSEKKGVLEVELEMGETIFCLGKFPWKNMAMSYDAFIGKPIEANKQKKKSLHWVCYGSATATM